MRNLLKRKILPLAFTIMMLAATPALAFAADGEAPAPTFEITKTASASTVAPGGEITYTIKVKINGDSQEGLPIKLSVQDTLQEGLEYVEGSLNWKGEDGLIAEPDFGSRVLNAPLFTQNDDGSKEEAVYPGKQSITFTYRAKADAGLADGTVLPNMAALSNDDGPVKMVEVPVTVVSPAENVPEDSGTDAGADTAGKGGSALDSSPKCGDNFLLGWLFELIGITN